jgi:hypothetical protein
MDRQSGPMNSKVRDCARPFGTLPGASFIVNNAAHDAALTTASAEVKWRNGFSLAATFEGEFSNVTASYAGKGVALFVVAGAARILPSQGSRKSGRSVKSMRHIRRDSRQNIKLFQRFPRLLH